MKWVGIIGLLILPALGFGQDIIYFNTIAGTYQMEDLKAFQDELQEDFELDGFPLVGVRNFPASLQWELGVTREEGEITYGGFLNYALTEGKLHYSDYSGEVSAELQVLRIMLGGRAAKRFHKDFQAYAKLGINRSQMNLLSSLTLKGGEEQVERMGFYAFGLNLEPGIAWDYSFKNLVFSVSGGYELGLQSKTFFDEYDNAYLTHGREEPVILNWSGFRLGVGVGVRLL